MFKFVAEKLLDIALDAGINSAQNFIKDKISKGKYVDALSEYLKHQKKYNGVCSMAEEYDFGSLCEYFRGNGIEKIKIAISGTESERKAARRELYDGAYVSAGAKTSESKSAIYRIVSASVEILRIIAKGKITFEDKVLAAEIEDTVNRHTDEIVATNTLEIKKEIQQSSQFSFNQLIQLKNDGDYEGIETWSAMVNNAVAATHTFYPDYRAEPSGKYGGQLISIPTSNEAINKMPPRFVCKGTAKMGNKILHDISPEDIDYADRHQLPITLTITEAKKFLGEFEDPYQHEADSLIGAQITRQPKKFEPAQPYSIKVDDVVIYQYIELGLVEILDDGTLVITNESQIKAPIMVRLNINIQTHSVSVNVTILDKSNVNELAFARLMRAAMNNKIISFCSLKQGVDFIRACFRDCDYESGFANIDEEIDFMERICDMETYFRQAISVPQEVSVEEFNMVIYLSEMIRGKTVECTRDKFKCNGIVDDDFRNRISNMSNEASDYAFVGEKNISFIGSTFTFPILRIIKNAKIEKFETVKQLAELLDNGDNIPITIISESASYLDQIAPDELSIGYALCPSKGDD